MSQTSGFRLSTRRILSWWKDGVFTCPTAVSVLKKQTNMIRPTIVFQTCKPPWFLFTFAVAPSPSFYLLNHPSGYLYVDKSWRGKKKKKKQCEQLANTFWIPCYAWNLWGIEKKDWGSKLDLGQLVIIWPAWKPFNPQQQATLYPQGSKDVQM